MSSRTEQRTEAQADRPEARRTVRDVAFDVLRRHGLTTMFANPGSTEIPFLADLPGDFRFVLALHEGSAASMAAGRALALDEPQLVILHTTAGLGNAVNALATARVNRAPLVVLVGQQDRRHLVYEPFLAGRLDGLAGEYPVWVNQPIRAQDLPGAIARACHEARTHRGPALVVVPMNDWLAPAEDPEELAAPERIVHASAADAGAIAELAALVAAARSPALVVGAGADSPAAWAALVALAERLVCPVWQEAFGGRAGFPQDHPLFAGFLPAGRASLRETLAGYDVVVAVGAPVFRQYTYEPGPLVVEGTRVAVVTDFPDEAHRSPAELAVLAAPAAVCAALLDRVPARDAPVPKSFQRPPVPAPPASGEPLVASHVLQALADRLPPSAIVLEEAPSAGPELQARIPARRPLGFLRAAMGGLGFVLPAAIGLRMGAPDRPVVAILGDGSSLYGIQGLWSAVRYEVGPLFVVLANGGYRIMDSLAALHGGAAPWPSFEGIDIAGLARAFGCAAERIDTYDDLVRRLDAIVPGLADRQEPLLLEVVVAPHREA